MSILDARQSVLFVHAHPDDETISTGALIAELVARGTSVFLLTATRGERGEVVPGALSGLEGTDALTTEREHELQRATDALGIAERFWLGQPPARANGLSPRRYRDSGMKWIRPGLAGPADDVDDDALAVAPLAEVADDVAALIAHLRPSLVVSYDNGGGYGHPDHVRMHEAALAASRGQGTPFAEVRHAPDPPGEWFALDRHLHTVTAALRCHASQVTVDGSDIVHSGGQREPITTSIGLRILTPPRKVRPSVPQTIGRLALGALWSTGAWRAWRARRRG
ncbi:MAG TPA: GlcNAc-PI de-N-acetylase [Microbacteriaceae bacterium]|jgi:N-acetyl-1-D-myo-inositol-2-amino-2-deoxy-alpha-D-glucopyranoside deacetylase|nr:GlcNAc-PI de-N-acetylase [Microbacteriaceae bacterium]